MFKMEMSSGEGIAFGIVAVFSIILQLAILAAPFLLMGWATQAFANRVWPKPEKKISYGAGIGWWIVVWFCLAIIFTPFRLYFSSRLKKTPVFEQQSMYSPTDSYSFNSQ